MRTCQLMVLAFLTPFLLWGLRAAGQTPSGKAYLLQVSGGEMPNDTGMDDKTRFELVDNAPGLPGKALKVVFVAGDSIGVRQAKVSNWKSFTLLRLDVINPSQETINIGFNVSHARSTSYQTRVEVPVKLKPGKNEIKIGIDDMVNVNGSTPDLTRVRRWYLANSSDKGPTLFLGDVWLEGAEPPVESKPPPGQGSVLPPNTVFRVKGKIGNMDVDLTVTPLVPGAAPRPPALPLQGDPARLHRIKSSKMPQITRPILFNTLQADAICAALEVFPPDNPWNLLVEDWPVHPNSSHFIASMGADKPFRYNLDMGFVFVPPQQPKVALEKLLYLSESDTGPYPIPDETPIEGWPLSNRGLTLGQVQRMEENADRHGLIVDPVKRLLYEFYQLRRVGQGWQASQASIFDLKSNRLRPDGWTSADAAGLPIFPAVVRYDELKRGAIDHALRVTVPRTRKSYVYPATHHAGQSDDEDLPCMGERVRLRKEFDVSGFSREAQIILRALKRYGMFVADNGINWAISVAPDSRIPDMNEELRKVKGSDFEVVTFPAGFQPPE